MFGFTFILLRNVQYWFELLYCINLNLCSPSCLYLFTYRFILRLYSLLAVDNRYLYSYQLFSSRFGTCVVWIYNVSQTMAYLSYSNTISYRSSFELKMFYLWILRIFRLCDWSHNKWFPYLSLFNKWYPQFQKQLIFCDKCDCNSPYQKHQYGLFFPYPKTSSVCFAPYKTTVLNRIHEIFIESRKRKILSSRICRNVVYLRQISTKGIWL